jgi:NADPH:quinone reductase-like Zn-dependent oxidoreductase/NADP-dependent 3-hydroxy acid dehydrogenase YdfG
VDDIVPQGDQIQVRVHAAGLNFKDVLNALGRLEQYADEAGLEHHALPLGLECAGTVVAAGPEAEFQVGDEVMLSHLGCFKRRLTVPSAKAVRKPADLTFAEAAGVPTAYLTAYYSLHHLAGIKAGDRVLIHAAAGGVGQAAVQLAKLAGAEVYATASPRKWPVLQAQGVDHTMNSRTLDFAEEILNSTGGAGVDIVLNSLSNDYVAAGMRALGRGGRFVELGKIGVWSLEQAHQNRPDVAYHNFDLTELPTDELVALNRQLTVADLLGRAAVRPAPTTAYGLHELEEAFGLLSRGDNIGKLVISFVDDHAPAPQQVTVRPDETYLISGGMGALGLATAEKLVGLGARHLGLISRRAVPDEDVKALAARLGEGVDVTVYQGDVAEAQDVEQIAAAVRERRQPLGGIIHAAGVLADRPIASQTWEHIDTVFRSKVYGTWLLHELANSFPELRFFVGYSSVASVLGTPAQANYAAGNAFVDTLMHWRVAQHRPGLSINWGPWAEVGMAASLSARHIRAIEGQGMKFLKPAEGTRALAKALGQPVAQVVIGEFDWDRYVAGGPATNALYGPVARGSASQRPGAGRRHRVRVRAHRRPLGQCRAAPAGVRRGRGRCLPPPAVTVRHGGVEPCRDAVADRRLPPVRGRRRRLRAGGGLRGPGLKRQQDARADGDRPYAIIRGSAVYQHGDRAAISVASAMGHKRVAEQALRNAEIDPHQVQYVEAQANGSRLGGMIEVEALADVYGRGDPAAPRLYVGSCKANLGHLETASGAASLIKTVLALRQAEIPPQAGFDTPDPAVPWQRLAVTVPREPVAWPAAERRVAAVNAFGFTGTNAHVLLEAS